MKPGVIGAVLVLVGGAAAGGAVFLKDTAQVGRARTSLRHDAKERLVGGDLAGARSLCEDALIAADGVGGLTGRRGAALDVADDARRWVLVLDGLADPAKRPLAALRVAGNEGDTLLGGPMPDVVKAGLGRARAELALDAGLALEARGALEAAEKLLAPAAAEAKAGGSPRADEAEKALLRVRLRLDLGRCEQAVRSEQEDPVAVTLAELPRRLEAAKAAFAEAQVPDLVARVDAVTAEASDLAAVRMFERDVAALAAKVPTDALGTLRPAAEALKPPVLRGRHARADALAARAGKAEASRQKALERATQFEGMVLVGPLPGAGGLLFLDRTEVTNDAFERFVKARGYDPAGAHWSDAGRRIVERFLDPTGRPGPRSWKDGAPLPGKGSAPVTGVCLHEAQAFATWAGKRLPTLEEWQRAGGAEGSVYPWGPSWEAGRAHVKAQGVDAPEPVDARDAGKSPCGALGLVGNARELVTVPGGKPVAAGGSFLTLPDKATLQSTLDVSPTARAEDTGFRCVRELPAGE